MKTKGLPDYVWCNKAQLEEYFKVNREMMTRNKITTNNIKYAQGIINQITLEAYR